MQLDAPTTTTQTPVTCIDTVAVENTAGSSGDNNYNSNDGAVGEDNMRGVNQYTDHNSDPITINTQHDSTNNNPNSNNKGSPGTASYIAKITGYISKTINTDTTHNNNNTTNNNNNTMNIQYIYVNNRPVDLPKINRLINEIWLKYALKSRTNISYILNIHLPTYTYDINMSPNKREIVLLYEVDIINWMRITINRLYSETTHGVFLMNNSNNSNNNDMLGNKSSSSDNMLDYKGSNNSNKNDIQKVSTNKSLHISTTTTAAAAHTDTTAFPTNTTADSTNTTGTIDSSSTIQQQPTSSTSLLLSNDYPKDENSNNNIILSSQTTTTTTQNTMDINSDKNGVNFGLISPYIPRLTQSTLGDLTHLTHLDLIHDIDKEEEEEYNNNFDSSNNGEIDDYVDDVYTSNNDDINDNISKNNMSGDNNMLNTELQPSSSSSSVVWMDEPEVIIMTPPTESKSAHIHPPAVAAAASYIDNNTVGEKRKHSYHITDENINTTAHKSIKLNDNNSIPSSSSATTREIWANCHPTYANDNNNSNDNNSNSINAYTNSILESCADNVTSLLHYIHTHTLNTGYTHSHFSTLDFWFPDTTSTTNTDYLYNNEAYANNTAHIGTGSTDSVVADIIALFSVNSATTTPDATTLHTDATATATTPATNSTSVDTAQAPTDEEPGPATSSKASVTAAISEEEPLYTLKTISKEVCINILCTVYLCIV